MNLDVEGGLENAARPDAERLLLTSVVPIHSSQAPTMLSLPTPLHSWLQRLSQMIAVSTPLSHLAMTRAHCPHCERETPWAAHAMSAFYRCRRCGHNPLTDSFQTG